MTDSKTPLEKQINALPVSLAGKLFYYLLPYRRKVIQSNIDQVFADSLSSAAKLHLIKAYYSHLASSIKEAFQMRYISKEKLKDSVEVKGEEWLFKMAEKNQGILILTGHFGNWEFAPIGGIMNFEDFKGRFHFIRKSIGAKWLEKILFKRYYEAGLNVIPMKNSLGKVCDALEENHAVVFVMDQHAIIDNRDGLAVEFFGKKAGTYRSLATIARHYQASVVPAAGYRKANGQHVLEFFPPIPWQEHEDRKTALYQNTLAYNQALEQLVLAHPEQWHWLHKRWKLKG